MVRRLIALAFVAGLVGCGEDDSPKRSRPPVAQADAPLPADPRFDPDDPAYGTIPDDSADQDRLVALTEGRDDLRVPASAVGAVTLGRLVAIVATPLFLELEPGDRRLDKLSAGQRAVHALYLADFEILNGGFEQLWSNSAGYFAADLVDAARRVGSPQLEDIFADAQALWPGDEIPRSRSKRQQALAGLPAEALAALDERYAATQYRRDTAQATVLGTYIRRHLAEFVVR